MGADGDLIASYDQFIQAKSAHLAQQQVTRVEPGPKSPPSG
ncbi:MAG TPA: hypothetical protein VFO16_18220 [Pseudonocardiaceae bacterium]|nr:hypothetical protein [Pseudonocardiaceae bacterium]